MYLLFGCAPTMSAVIAVTTPCPNTPNCVSSLAADAEHGIAPLPLIGPIEGAIPALMAIVLAFPGAALVEQTPTTLAVTFTSRWFRFVDDVSFAVEAGQIQVRSASRVGRGDLGVNRRRVEAIRAALLAGG